MERNNTDSIIEKGLYYKAKDIDVPEVRLGQIIPTPFVWNLANWKPIWHASYVLGGIHKQHRLNRGGKGAPKVDYSLVVNY